MKKIKIMMNYYKLHNNFMDYYLPNRGPVFGVISCSCKPSSICGSRRCSKGSTFTISMISGGLFYRIRPGTQIFLDSKKKISVL